MGPGRAILMGFLRTGNFSGRAGLTEFWWFAPLAASFLVLAWRWSGWPATGIVSPATVLLGTIALSLVSLAVRRVHDADVAAGQLLYGPMAALMIVGYFVVLLPFLFRLSVLLGVLFGVVVGFPLLLVGLAKVSVEAVAGWGALFLPSTPGPNRYGPPPGATP